MGQKVHPNGIRLGIIRDWDSKWFATGREYSEQLIEDQNIRSFLKTRLANAAVSKVRIERNAENINVRIHTARPGIVIGKKGQDIEKLRAQLNARVKGVVSVSVEEMRKPELDAQLVADSIAQQLVGRVAYRRATKRSLQNAMRLGAEGIKIMVSGRLNGAEIARKEWYREGRVPLHTLRADVDYATAEALTTYGILGIKVWIYKGEIFADSPVTESTEDKKTAKAQ
ncbi:MAG: 30S ribosomal protein S3 [Proteobacteria bacterium]|nr:30S ribosomal protein S3 [Pseudomonadota bacterium]